MGFDVLYLPPIHPIGYAHRKGKNNSLQALQPILECLGELATQMGAMTR